MPGNFFESRMAPRRNTPLPAVKLRGFPTRCHPSSTVSGDRFRDTPPATPCPNGWSPEAEPLPPHAEYSSCYTGDPRSRSSRSRNHPRRLRQPARWNRSQSRFSRHSSSTSAVETTVTSLRHRLVRKTASVRHSRNETTAKPEHEFCHHPESAFSRSTL